MSLLSNVEPSLRDYVKHKNNPDGIGIVIAKYISLKTGKIALDVRGDDNYIYYETPIENWEVTRLNDEAEG